VASKGWQIRPKRKSDLYSTMFPWAFVTWIVNV
jgi:hypothetical protein